LLKKATFTPQVSIRPHMIPTPPRQRDISLSLHGAHHNMVVHEWGDPTNPAVIVCVHGLSRNGRDFDVIANALASTHRVLCPDVLGRGRSDWLPNVEDYVIPVYVDAMTQMLSQLRITRYDWIGTSMGGLIGMGISATVGNGMQRFVCNDVGPDIERPALERIGAYMGMRAPTFESYEQLYRAAQLAIHSFGPLTDAQKHHIVRTSCQEADDGTWQFNSDPKIGAAFVEALKQPAVNLWPLWQARQRPTLVLRGAHSDLLSQATFDRMVQGKAHVRGHTVPDTGHAPMLMDVQTIDIVSQFLRM
jgi:pimeloyl-ACP methyl ester carboxylesterase